MKKRSYFLVVLGQLIVISLLLLPSVKTNALPVQLAFCVSSCPGGCGMVGGNCWSSGCDCGCSGGGFSWSERCPVEGN